MRAPTKSVSIKPRPIQSIFTVAFWAVPALALYLLLAWSMTAAVAEGIGLAVLFITTWWSSATDTHSTAGLGPGVAGLLVAPAIVLAVAIGEHWR